MATEGHTDSDAQGSGHSGSLVGFIKSLAGFNGDLSSITAPSFILSSVSLTEYSAYWAEHPDLFIQPALEKDPEKRALAVLRWFIATLKGQYSSRNEKLGSEKKPLNPILGELFLGSWQTKDNSETTLISEQVSHHPPVTAYSIYNPQHGVLLNGHNGQKASISGVNLTIKQIGHAILTLKPFNEQYLITFPFIRIEGVLYGAPYIELDKSSYIQSSSGYNSKIEYAGKGYFSGKKNSFKATLDKDGKTLHTVTGVWTDSCVIGEGEKPKHTRPFWDSKSNPAANAKVKPVAQEGEWESRKMWEKVAAAINAGDMNATTKEKSKLENWQRELRKKEQAEGRTWERRFFQWTEPDQEFERLAKPLGMPSEGSWKFDEQGYAEASKSTANKV